MRLAYTVIRSEEAVTRLKAPCPYFGNCGGCALQDVSYEDQLLIKKNRLLNALSKIDPALNVEIVGMQDPWRYRNKAELTFGNRYPSDSKNGKSGLALGYHAHGSFWKIVDIEDCLLLPKGMSGIISDVRAIVEATGNPAYDSRRHSGFFRYLMMRQSQIDGAVQLALITTKGDVRIVESIADTLLSKHRLIRSFYWGINTKIADISFPDEISLIRGVEYLEDRMGPFSIRLHPFNFLQTNTSQAQKVYESIRGLAGEYPSGNAWDLYCGIGLIGFYISSKFCKVYAVDSDSRNIALAALSAEKNGISNMEFRSGSTEDVLSNRRFWLNEAKPDLIVVDPPRAGLHQRSISSILSARPKQILYLSCNTSSLVRDLHDITSGFPHYKINTVSSFDLFPHTPHLEVLALLCRN